MTGNASEHLVLVDYINNDTNQRKFVLRAKDDFKYERPQNWYLTFSVCFEKEFLESEDPWVFYKYFHVQIMYSYRKKL